MLKLGVPWTAPLLTLWRWSVTGVQCAQSALLDILAVHHKPPCRECEEHAEDQDSKPAGGGAPIGIL